MLVYEVLCLAGWRMAQGGGHRATGHAWDARTTLCTGTAAWKGEIWHWGSKVKTDVASEMGFNQDEQTLNLAGQGGCQMWS